MENIQYYTTWIVGLFLPIAQNFAHNLVTEIWGNYMTSVVKVLPKYSEPLI